MDGKDARKFEAKWLIVIIVIVSSFTILTLLIVTLLLGLSLLLSISSHILFLQGCHFFPHFPLSLSPSLSVSLLFSLTILQISFLQILILQILILKISILQISFLITFRSSIRRRTNQDNSTRSQSGGVEFKLGRSGSSVEVKDLK